MRSVQMYILVVLGPMLFLLGVGVARWRSGHYLRARYAVSLLVIIVLLACACAWLADQTLMPWYFPVSVLWVKLTLHLLQSIGFAAIVVLAFEAGGVVGHAIKLRQQLTRGHLVVLLAFIVILPALTGVSRTAHWLSRGADDALLTNFQRHEAAFQRLAEMAVEDDRFSRIAPDSFPAHRSVVARQNAVVDPLPVERQEEYRALLRTTDVRDGLLIYRGGRRIEFMYWYKPLILDRVDRGYVYLADPPGPVMRVTADGWIVVREEAEIYFLYRQIADRWYQFDVQW